MWLFNLFKEPLILRITFIKILLFSLVIGCLSYLLLPPVNFYLIEFILFIPIIYIYHPINNNLKYKYVFLYGLLSGFYVTLFYTRWIIHTIVTFGSISYWLAVCILCLYSFYIALKFALLFFIPFFLKKKFNFPILTGILCSCFLIELLFPEVFPFYIGSAQLYHSYFVQIADIIGVQGISLLVLAINYFIYRLLVSYDKRNFLFILIIIFVTYSYSFLRTIEIESYKTPYKSITKIQVGVVQPNIPFGYITKNNIKKYSKILIDETNKILKKNKSIDLLVWPESAIPFSLDQSKEAQNLKYFINNLSIPIIYNVATEDNNSYYSTAVFHTPNQVNDQFYYKNMLLPFGEYLPTDIFFPQLHKFFPEIGNFQPGITKNIFHLNPSITLAPLICYEITMPDFTRQFIQKGANVIVNLTNDSWFGNTQASLYHLYTSSFRAIENRVPIIRATNSGISTVIDIKGWPIHEYTKLYEQTSFVQRVDIYSHIFSIFTYFGNYTVGIILLLLLIGKYLNKSHWLIKK